MKRLFLLAFSAATVLSCARSEIQPIGGDGRFGLTVEQLPFESVDPATRAIENSSNNTVFQSGDAIGVYVHTSAAVGATGNHSSNMCYVTSDKGATWKAANSLGGELSGATNKATAYYPFQAGLLNPTAVVHTVAVDQSATDTGTETEAGALERSDFMVAPAAAITGVPDAPKSTLIFAHAMCKLVVKVGVPTIIDGSPVSKVKSITIGGTKIAATVNISTATPTVTVTGSAANITPRLKSGDGTAGKIAEYEAIVVPQTVAAGILLVDIVCATDGGDKPLRYTVPTGQSLALAQGKKVTLTLSSSADLAFTSELDLMRGLAATNLPLKIKAPSGAAWTLQSSQTWLTLATTSGGTYSAKITGTGTGADQTVYVKVDANNAATTPRESILTLSTNTGSIIYGALQNYYKFEVKATSVDITKDGTAVALPEAITNQVWNLALVDATLPSWAKIVKGSVATPPVWKGSTSIIFPYEVIGSLNSPVTAATLFVVADVTTLSTSREFKIKYGTTEITIKQAAAKPDNTILINGLYWATGNLVAVSSAAGGVATGTDGTKVKIGDPTDGGLYFQFGSLIGYKGGKKSNGGTGVGIPDGTLQTDGTYWNGSFSWANDAHVWPTTFTNGPSGIGATWPPYNSNTDNRHYFGYATAPYDKAGQKLSAYTNWENGKMVSATVAVGDPCRYYLGDTWRIPTAEDFGNLFNNVYPNGTVGGTWNTGNWGYNNTAIVNGKRANTITSSTYSNDANSPNTGRGIYVNTTVTTPPATAPDVSTLFFPASGYRNNSNGSFHFVGRSGYCWSGSVYNATSGFNLYFNATSVSPQHYGSRSNGFPVRCVSEP